MEGYLKTTITVPYYNIKSKVYNTFQNKIQCTINNKVKEINLKLCR